MILYHGSNLEIEAVDLTKCRPFKDFGRGFYLTDIKEQAFKMAQRVARIYGGAPVVNVYETDLEKKAVSTLHVLRFPVPDRKWAHFVMNNRNPNFEHIESPDCNTDCKYDVVIGPVANDDLALLFRQFTDGMITEDILIREMQYKRLTSQYSFHTEKALRLLKKRGAER